MKLTEHCVAVGMTVPIEVALAIGVLVAGTGVYVAVFAGTGVFVGVPAEGRTSRKAAETGPQLW